MRSSDWSSDVCSSDLERTLPHRDTHKILHARELLGGRINVVLAQFVDAHGGRADERGDVGRDAARRQEFEVFTERGPFDRVTDVALLLQRIGLHRVVERAHRPALAEDLQGYALLRVDRKSTRLN